MANFTDGNIQFEVDLQDFFGFPRGTGIGYMITHAGADGRINKWAKFKPTRATGTTRPTDYWKGYQQDAQQTCGVFLPDDTEITQFFTKYLAGQYSWTYLYPRGESQSPKEWFRSMDFAGYNHEAQSPLPEPPEGRIAYTKMRTFLCSLPSVAPTGCLDISNLQRSNVSLDTYYIGLLLTQNSSRQWCTAKETILQGRATLEQKHTKIAFNLQGLTGTWQARTFLTNRPLTQNEVPTDANPHYYIPCEGYNEITLVHTTDNYEINIVRAKWVSNTRITIRVDFFNGKSTDVVLSGATIDISGGGLTELFHVSIPTTTIAALDTYAYINSQIDVTTHPAQANVFVSGTFGTQTISASAPVGNL